MEGCWGGGGGGGAARILCALTTEGVRGWIAVGVPGSVSTAEHC